MQFNSYIFILVYLPILIIGYFGLNKISPVMGKLFLIVASAIFYIYGGWKIAIILTVSIAVNYILAVIINQIERLLWGGYFLKYSTPLLFQVLWFFYFQCK